MSDPLTIPTAREDVTLRQFVVGVDESAFLDAINEDHEHLSRHGNSVVDKYKTASDVTVAWQRASVEGRLSMGIWTGSALQGEIHAIPSPDGEAVDVGFWLRRSAVGHGYATLAVSALTSYLSGRFTRVFAEIHADNLASMRVMERAGYVRTGEVSREWGEAMVYEHRE